MNGLVVGEVAKEAMGRPDAHIASLARLSAERDGIDAVRIEVYDAPLITRGLRAGRPNWRKKSNLQSRIIPMSELETLAAARSERTGKCLDCGGQGRLFVRWSSTDGTTWRTCPACNAGTVK